MAPDSLAWNPVCTGLIVHALFRGELSPHAWSYISPYPIHIDTSIPNHLAIHLYPVDMLTADPAFCEGPHTWRTLQWMEALSVGFAWLPSSHWRLQKFQVGYALVLDNHLTLRGKCWPVFYWPNPVILLWTFFCWSCKGHPSWQKASEPSTACVCPTFSVIWSQNLSSGPLNCSQHLWSHICGKICFYNSVLKNSMSVYVCFYVVWQWWSNPGLCTC